MVVGSNCTAGGLPWTIGLESWRPSSFNTLQKMMQIQAWSGHFSVGFLPSIVMLDLAVSGGHVVWAMI